MLNLQERNSIVLANLIYNHIKRLPDQERKSALDSIVSRFSITKRSNVEAIISNLLLSSSAGSSEISNKLNVISQAPKILHRCYLTNFPPYRDPYLDFLETWREQLPNYEIIMWGKDNVNFLENEWMTRSFHAGDPVFISEFVRWKALNDYGGIYLDADCQVVNGSKLNTLLEELSSSVEYDAFLGVEEFHLGHPTAQTVASRPGSDLCKFMLDMYKNKLSGPMWHWRTERGLIGPQLISLYFRDRGLGTTKGFPVQLKSPIIVGRVKIYPQDYFSPKYATEGKDLRISDNTCVYHLFANENVKDVPEENQKIRSNPMLFKDYIKYAKKASRPWKSVIANSRHSELLPYSLKKLHRIYFGFDGKPDPYLQYLSTWEQQLPGYEICLWDATNLPLQTCEFTRRAFKDKDHAFLSDYFRWWVLREYGGIYLDADVEVTNGSVFDTLVSELEISESLHSFIGIDSKSDGWYTAHSMASKRQSPLTRFMCNVYENLGPLSLWRRKVFYFMAPQLTSLYFTDRGFNVDGMGSQPNLSAPLVCDGVKIYPQDWFSPMRPHMENGKGGFVIDSYTSNTCLCHHFSCSWHDSDSPYRQSRNNDKLPLLAELV